MAILPVLMPPTFSQEHVSDPSVTLFPFILVHYLSYCVEAEPHRLSWQVTLGQVVKDIYILTDQ